MKTGVVVWAAALTLASGITTRADQSTSPATAEINGRVTNKTGSTAAGVDVIADPMAPGFAKRARTDRDGTYRLLDLAPGEYRLLFSLSGFQTTILEHVRVRATHAIDALIRVAPHVEPILWTRPGFSGGFLAGRVADPGGRLWAGVSVTLTGQPVPAEYAVLSGTWPELITDVNGLFVFGPFLPVGTYHLRVTAAGFDTADLPVEVTLNRRTETNVTLRLRPARRAPGTSPSSLLVETKDGAWIMEPLGSDGTALATFLADVDGHRLDHSWGKMDDAYFSDMVSRAAARMWRWELSGLVDTLGTVSVTPTDNPTQPVRFRIRERLTPFGPTVARFVLAVSRLE